MFAHFTKNWNSDRCFHNGNILEVEKIKKLWRGSWDSLASHTLYTEIKGLANIELLLRNAIINIVVR